MKLKLELEFDIYGDSMGYVGSAMVKPGSTNISVCPFCGSYHVEATNTWTASYRVQCNDCGAQGPCTSTKVGDVRVLICIERIK